jgi:hypothetical protein
MNIPAKFEVSRVVSSLERGGTQLVGRIASGAISKGMLVHVWIDGGLFWEIPVQSVECSKRNDVEEIALVLPLHQREELEWLEGLCSTGTVVDVVHGASEQA